ncbi:hypothetical protein CMUS01_06077 [Colletotrichum musicola]|uniref:Uncharacterized protein n=1 Tax=Colletotrichum musicola TaxID=2175873 RepID=A0A8H6KNU3_9PEZI|nr:hypothetical protein CMUS01_06077 [Colletotrichum musicola]
MWTSSSTVVYCLSREQLHTKMDILFEPHVKLDLFPRVSSTRSGFAGRSASALPYSSTQAPPARSMKMVYQ